MMAMKMNAEKTQPKEVLWHHLFCQSSVSFIGRHAAEKLSRKILGKAGYFAFLSYITLRFIVVGNLRS